MVKHIAICLITMLLFCWIASAEERIDFALETGVPDDLLIIALDKSIERLVNKFGEKHWLYGKKNRERHIISEQILTSSKLHTVPPFLVVTVIYRESKFNPKMKGKRGEIGLMQTHGVAISGCDLSTPEGQIDCGTKYIRTSIDYCGGISLLRGLAVYASGYCDPNDEVKKKMEDRLDMYLSLWRDAKNDLTEGQFSVELAAND